MALSLSNRNPQVIRFNFSADAANAGFDYVVNRTLAVVDSTVVLSTSAAAQNFQVRKAATAIVTLSTTNTANEVIRAATIDLAQAYFVAGDTMNFIASNNVLRGICQVTVLPGTTSTS